MRPHVFAFLLLLLATTAHAALIQQLDASIAASVGTTSGAVTRWTDLSGAGRDATAGGGRVLYPAAGTFKSGLPGADFGNAPNFLQLFAASDQRWLDQRSAGAQGFAVFVAFKINALNPDWNDLLGNSTGVESGFALRYSSDGTIQGYLGGTVIQKASAQLAPGDSVVFAANYDPRTGVFEFWDSTNYRSQTAAVAAADFTRAALAVNLGRTEFDNRSFNGLVGEVRVYDAALSAAEFRQVRESLAGKWIGLPPTIAPNWRVIPAGSYARDDVFVAGFRIDDPGLVLPADPANQDCTAAFAQAIRSAAAAGGGVIHVPAGQYRIDGNLLLPPSVILRGDWQQPVPGQPIRGTLLKAYAGRGRENGPPFIGLSESSGVRDLAIWYPEQDPRAIQPYPPTLQSADGSTHNIQNVTLVNPYIGITTYLVRPTGTEGAPFLRHIYGTPLKLGIELDRLAEVGRIETVHFSPAFWQGSGLPGAPTQGEHAAWIYANGTGLVLRRIDWSYSAYVTLEGYNIGLALRPSRLPGDTTCPNGQCYGFKLLGCRTGVFLENTLYAGVLLTRFDIRGAETGVYSSPTGANIALFHTCSIDAAGAAVFNEGDEKLLFQNCVFSQGVVRADNGHLVIASSAFSTPAGHHVELGASARATLVGNWFDGTPRIANNSTRTVYLDHAPLAADELPAYDYAQPTAPYRPAKSDLFVVTSRPFGAVGDGVADDTPAFQSALAAGRANGGGIVFVPAGSYRLAAPLVVPAGVELRGIHDIAHSSKGLGSVLLVYPGRNDANGTPFLQLESRAGLRGLTFHYPEQVYDPRDPVNYGLAPYPFLIRGLGADIYAIDLAATIPYQLLDLATVRCDRHYVDYLWATAIKTGIVVGAGSADGQIQNCQLNPSSYSQAGASYPSIPAGDFAGLTSLLWSQAQPYTLGNVVNEVFHQNFVFGGAVGLHLLAESGIGPSAHCLGLGADQNVCALLVDAIGPGGFSPINTQLVSVDTQRGRYIELGAGFNQRFGMFATAGWGNARTGVLVNAGQLDLQLAHLHRVTGSAFDLRGTGRVVSLAGNLTNSAAPFALQQPGASALFAASLINTPPAGMPLDSATLTALGNLSRATDVRTPPAAPVSLVALATDAPVSLRWTANPEPDLNDYAVFRSSGGAFTPVATRVSGTTFADVTATPGTAYAYALAAVDSSGNQSPLSAPLTTVARASGANSHLANVSVRALAGTGSDTMILGFAIAPGSDKRLLLRGIGPGLTALGVGTTLADPVLRLFHRDGLAHATNDNWSDVPNLAQTIALTRQVGAFSLAPGARDAALLPVLAPGNYTVQITDRLGGDGVCLAEVYDATFDGNSAHLAAFSARARVGRGDQIVIAGFTVTGTQPKQLLLRAVGPGLVAFGVNGVLGDPTLTVTAAGAGSTLAANDNWSEAPSAATVATQSGRIGAFPLAPNSKDAALLMTLAPGVYAAQVRGAGDTTGVALVEVYELP